MITPRDKENAKRLAYVLYCHTEPQEIKRLAYILNYIPEQLQSDIEALDKVMQSPEVYKLLKND